MVNLNYSTMKGNYPNLNPNNYHFMAKFKMVSAYLLTISFFVDIIFQYSMLRFATSENGLWYIRLIQGNEYSLINYVLLWLTLLISLIPSFLYIASSVIMQLKKVKSTKLNGFVYFVVWYQLLVVNFYLIQFFLFTSTESSILSFIEPIVSQISILISFLLTYKGRYKIIGLKQPTSIIKSTFFILTAYIIILLFVDIVITQPIANFLHLDTSSWREQEISEQIMIAKDYGLLKSSLEVMMIGVLVPIAEEIMFRGIIQTALFHRFGKVTSIILTSLLFAIIHIDPISLASIFVIGIVLSWSRHYFDSLIPPILFHIIMNTTTSIIYLIQ